MEEAGSEGSAPGRGRKTQTAPGRGGVHKALSAKRHGAAPRACPASGGPGVGNRRAMRVDGLFPVFLDIRLSLADCTLKIIRLR